MVTKKFQYLYILPHLCLDATEQPSVSHYQDGCTEVLHASAEFEAFLEASCPQEICCPLSTLEELQIFKLQGTAIITHHFRTAYIAQLHTATLQ